MKFKIVEDLKINEGELIYTKEDYSFDFEPNLSADYSVLIGYINLTFDSNTKMAKQIWGCNPYQIWEMKGLNSPKSKKAGIMIEDHIESGSLFRLTEAGEWKTYFDKNSGWICIGDTAVIDDEDVIEFARNIVVVLKNSTIKSIWLKPRII